MIQTGAYQVYTSIKLCVISISDTLWEGRLYRVFQLVMYCIIYHLGCDSAPGPVTCTLPAVAPGCICHQTLGGDQTFFAYQTMGKNLSGRFVRVRHHIVSPAWRRYGVRRDETSDHAGQQVGCLCMGLLLTSMGFPPFQLWRLLCDVKICTRE